MVEFYFLTFFFTLSATGDPYSSCFHLNLFDNFSPRVDAQRVYREMRSGFSLDTQILFFKRIELTSSAL